MAETLSTQFNARGYNRIALVCSDMKQTVDFYTGILGFPLSKTMEFEDGTQQFIFKVTESDSLAFIWSPNAPPPAYGIAGQGFREDEFGNRLPGGGLSAPGAMHHLAFDVPLASMEEYKRKLRDAGVPTTMIVQHILYGDGRQQAMRTKDLPPDAENVDEFINSLYFVDPDGMVLEFASYTRELTPEDVKHVPATGAVTPASTTSAIPASR